MPRKRWRENKTETKHRGRKTVMKPPDNFSENSCPITMALQRASCPPVFYASPFASDSRVLSAPRLFDAAARPRLLPPELPGECPM